MNKIWILILFIALLILGLMYFLPAPQKVNILTKSTNLPSGISDVEGYATWQEFVPRSGLFKVMLPHPPQYAKDLVPVPGDGHNRRYDMYASEKIDGTLFLINVITYPPEADTGTSDKLLRQTVDELIQNKTDNRLAKYENTIFQNSPAVDFSINNKEFHVEGKAFMKDNIIYVLNYITRLNDFDQAEYKHFIDSFSLTPRESSAS